MALCALGGETFQLQLAAPGSKPKLDDHGIQGKTQPKGDAEELARAQVGNTAGREEYAHDRAGGGNAKKYSDCARHPPQMQPGISMSQLPGAKQAKQEQSVEEENRGTFDPPADRIPAHQVSGETDDRTQWK